MNQYENPKGFGEDNGADIMFLKPQNSLILKMVASERRVESAVDLLDPTLLETPPESEADEEATLEEAMQNINIVKVKAEIEPEPVKSIEMADSLWNMEAFIADAKNKKKIKPKKKKKDKLDDNLKTGKEKSRKKKAHKEKKARSGSIQNKSCNKSSTQKESSSPHRLPNPSSSGSSSERSSNRHKSPTLDKSSKCRNLSGGRSHSDNQSSKKSVTPHKSPNSEKSLSPERSSYRRRSPTLGESSRRYKSSTRRSTSPRSPTRRSFSRKSPLRRSSSRRSDSPRSPTHRSSIRRSNSPSPVHKSIRRSPMRQSLRRRSQSPRPAYKYSFRRSPSPKSPSCRSPSPKSPTYRSKRRSPSPRSPTYRSKRRSPSPRSSTYRSKRRSPARWSNTHLKSLSPHKSPSRYRSPTPEKTSKRCNSPTHDDSTNCPGSISQSQSPSKELLPVRGKEKGESKGDSKNYQKIPVIGSEIKGPSTAGKFRKFPIDEDDDYSQLLVSEMKKRQLIESDSDSETRIVGAEAIVNESDAGPTVLSKDQESLVKSELGIVNRNELLPCSSAPETKFFKQEIKSEVDDQQSGFLDCYYCKHCQLSLNSELTWQSHINGKKHAKMLKLQTIHEVARGSIIISSTPAIVSEARKQKVPKTATCVAEQTDILQNN